MRFCSVAAETFSLTLFAKMRLTQPYTLPCHSIPAPIRSRRLNFEEYYSNHGRRGNSGHFTFRIKTIPFLTEGPGSELEYFASRYHVVPAGVFERDWFL